MTTIKPRLWHTIRQPVSDWVRRRSMVQKLAAEYGYTVRILNDGQHWEFRRGVVMLEWWPSTGTTRLNQSFDLSRMHTLDSVRSALKQFA